MKITIIFFLVTFTYISVRAQIPAYIPTGGLVAWYPFTGNANDSSGNGNNGTVTGATLTTDRFGHTNSAYNFNGSTSMIQLVMPAIYAPSSSSFYSTSLWFNKYSNSTTSKMIWQFMDGTTTNISNYDFYSDHLLCSQKTLAVQNYPFYNPSACGPDTIALNQWYHICIVFDQVADTFSLYKNGVYSFGGPIGTIRPSSGYLTIGNNSNGIFGFDGSIDDIGIWNRALTPCEISQLYTGTIFSIGSITSPSNVCVGSTITLADTSTGGIWNSSSTRATVSGGSVTGVTVGTDTIKYTVTNSCGSVTVTSLVTITPLPNPIVIYSAPALSTSSPYISYQWLIGGSPISGATNATYNVVLNGAYSVVVTDSNGCTATSAVTIITNVGVQNIPLHNYNIKVYPNPSQSKIIIESPVNVDIQLTTIDGRLLMNKKKVKEIDISNLPADVYILNVYEAGTHLKLKTDRVVKLN